MAGASERWVPLTVSEAALLLIGAPFRWWVAGGHALELHVGRRWRTHHDLDIGLVRSQAPAAYAWLAGWDLQVATGGRLRPWNGDALSAERGENNVWARRARGAPWSFDLTIGAGNDVEWVYRRDPSVARPWAEAVLEAPIGAPYLAPDLQLLFKAKDPRPTDDTDAAEVISVLQGRERAFLAGRLPAAHPWQDLLRRRSSP